MDWFGSKDPRQRDRNEEARARVQTRFLTTVIAVLMGMIVAMLFKRAGIH